MSRKADFHHEFLNHGAPNNGMHPTPLQRAFYHSFLAIMLKASCAGRVNSGVSRLPLPETEVCGI